MVYKRGPILEGCCCVALRITVFTFVGAKTYHTSLSFL